MVSKFDTWWQKASKPLDAVIVTAPVGLLALVVLIILGYLLNWPWTGLHGRTLYDWLQLLIIPAVLVVGGYLFNYTIGRNERQVSDQHAQTEREAAEKRAQTERDIALDNQREGALQAYISRMSELLLEKNLRKSAEKDEVRVIAWVLTMTILPRLDATRKSSALLFLHGSGLIEKGKYIIDLSGANLVGANLRTDNLSGSSLRKTNLSYANLNYINLSGADLSGANFAGVDLSGANLKDATGITIEELEKQAKSLQDAIMPDGSKHL